MIQNVEIKICEDKQFRIIFYDDNGTSTGFILSKQVMYELYSSQREIFKVEEEN